MPISTFLGLETALRGVTAEQQAIETTSHNIANANTVGYSRQEAVFGATAGYQIEAGIAPASIAHIGTGVEITAFNRIRDTFLDAQYRGQAMQVGDQTARSAQLSQAETALNEPGANGISAQLQKFWNAWGDVSNNPSSVAARQSLVDQGKNLAASFATLDQQLATVKGQANSEYASITGAQGDVTQIAGQIAALNGAIEKTSQSGDKPNDLLDRRDALLDQLSQLGQVSVTALSNGGVQVSLGDAAQPLVADQTVNWPQTLTAPGGKLGALLAIGGTGGTIDSYRAQLSATVKQLADSVNAIHSTGSPSGVNFFSYTAGSEASTLQVAVTPQQVVTSTTGAADANNLAIQIGQLRGGAADQAYTGFVTRVGGDVKSAQLGVTNSNALLTAIDNRRQSTSGVSMDEEMSNLVRFQRGYQASGRAMSAIDTMLDDLINHTGRVGL